MQTIKAGQALTLDGWRKDVEIDIADDGFIAAVRGDCASGTASSQAIALPAPANLHSHTFQRAMAGMTERRGPSATDSFWTWRDLMYRFLDRLTPDDVEAIAALTFMEMQEAGYGAVAEFHYLHHQVGGAPHARLSEMTERIFAAARETGIGLTHLPVFYMQGGLDGRALAGGQQRFGCDLDLFGALYSETASLMKHLPADSRLGVAPHSLRAASRDGIALALSLCRQGPVHMHIAEQTGEIEEVAAATGRRPVEWLFDSFDVGEEWCLIHCTHMEPHETEMLARSGAVAGLCPITEGNLGDGLFDGRRFVSAGGLFGVGSDSNVTVTLKGELRMLEYAQRLKERLRVVMATPERSAGRFLHDMACAGGARALARKSGAIAVGNWADITVLDGAGLTLDGATGDAVLDHWIFGGDGRLVSDVWSAGRHVVSGGRHIARDRIESRYRAVLAKLRASL